MLHIILQILTVLGIILLSILGLLVFLLLLVLFVPVRYKATASRLGENLKADVKITWLLHLISVVYHYPVPGEIIVKVLGFRVWRMKSGEVTEKTSSEEKEADSVAKAADVSEERTGTVAPKAVDSSGNTTCSKEKSDTAEETDPQNDPQGDSQNVGTRKKPAEIFAKIQYTFRNICDKIKKIIENYEYYRDLLSEKENRLLFGRCKDRIFKVLKSIRPRTLKADLLFGTGEPDTTGYVLAVYGMLIPVLGNHINITPDFEETVLEGNVFAKGRITVFTILWNGAALFWDKQLHTLLKKLKREDV